MSPPRETGVHFDGTRWEMWAFGTRVAMMDERIVRYAKIDLLAPWRAAAAIEGPHRDVVCALVCMDRGYAATAAWDWVRMQSGTRSVEYMIPQPISILYDYAPPDLRKYRAEVMRAVINGGEVEFAVALAPEIRTVYWHP